MVGGGREGRESWSRNARYAQWVRHFSAAAARNWRRREQVRVGDGGGGEIYGGGKVLLTCKSKQVPMPMKGIFRGTKVDISVPMFRRKS